MRTATINTYASGFLAFYIYANIIALLVLGAGCTTDGCKATADLIVITEMQLNILGLMFAVALFLLRNKKNLFNPLLLSGFIFETMIFAYQLKSGIFCIFCFFVWFLIFIMVVNSFREKLIQPFMIFATIIVATAILKENTLSTTSVFSENSPSIITAADCQYCMELKDFLIENNLEYTEIAIEENPSLVGFLNNLDMKTVPVLVKKEKQHLEIVNGVDNIKNSFLASFSSIKNPLIESNNNMLSLEGKFFQNSFGQKDGCSVSVDCKEDDK